MTEHWIKGVYHDKKWMVITALSVLAVFSHNVVAFGQVANLTEIILLKFPERLDPSYSPYAMRPVDVRYESPSSIVIGGDLIFFGVFNTDLWKAMDLLKNQYGFNVEHVMTSGVGSVGNPTNIYILMTK
jgi:hypothetical protein